MTNTQHLNKINEALQALQRGEMIIVSDNEDREDEGDVVMSASKVTNANINFMITHCKGLVCAPIKQQLANKLKLTKMWQDKAENSIATNFTVPIDHSSCRTGISASERATTLLALANPNTKTSDFHKPGHVFPIVAHPQGLNARQGHTEATITLLEACNLPPIGIICEIIGSDGEMLRGKNLHSFAKKHKLLQLHISEISERFKIKN